MTIAQPGRRVVGTARQGVRNGNCSSVHATRGGRSPRLEQPDPGVSHRASRGPGPGQGAGNRRPEESRAPAVDVHESARLDEKPDLQPVPDRRPAACTPVAGPLPGRETRVADGELRANGGAERAGPAPSVLPASATAESGQPLPHRYLLPGPAGYPRLADEPAAPVGAPASAGGSRACAPGAIHAFIDTSPDPPDVPRCPSPRGPSGRPPTCPSPPAGTRRSLPRAPRPSRPTRAGPRGRPWPIPGCR